MTTSRLYSILEVIRISIPFSRLSVRNWFMAKVKYSCLQARLFLVLQYSGCVCRCVQYFYHNTQSLGLRSLWHNKKRSRSICPHLIVLPLLSVEEVERTEEELIEKMVIEFDDIFPWSARLVGEANYSSQLKRFNSLIQKE